MEGCVKLLPEQHTVNESNKGYSGIQLVKSNGTVSKLNLSKNQLTKITCSLQRFAPNLYWLSVAHNKLTGESANFSGLSNLKKLCVLNLGSNEMTEVPTKVFQSLTDLRALILSQNRLKVFHPLKLPNLTSLILSRNALPRLDAAVLSSLPLLEKLSLSHNKLKKVPKLASNTRLKELRLNSNRIPKLPSLKRNVALQVLDIGNNALSGWDVVKLQAPLLRNLNLKGNSDPVFEKPPPECQKESGNALALEKFLWKRFPLLKSYNTNAIGSNVAEKRAKKKQFVADWKQKNKKLVQECKQKANIYSYGASTRKRKNETDTKFTKKRKKLAQPDKDDGGTEAAQPTAKRKKSKSKKSTLAPAEGASGITCKQPKKALPKPKKPKKNKKKKSKQKQKASSAGSAETGTDETATKTQQASEDEQRRLIAALSVGVDDVDELTARSGVLNVINRKRDETPNQSGSQSASVAASAPVTSAFFGGGESAWD